MTGSPTTADEWNARYPVGTIVKAYPLTRQDPPLHTATRSKAWTLGDGTPVVSVEGYSGGISLAFVDALGSPTTEPRDESVLTDAEVQSVNGVLAAAPGFDSQAEVSRLRRMEYDALPAGELPHGDDWSQALADVAAEAEARGRVLGRQDVINAARERADVARAEWPRDPFVSMEYVNGCEDLADFLEALEGS